MYLLPISETATNSATNFLSAYCLYSTRHLDFVIADDVMNICDYVCAEYMNNYRSGDNFLGSDCLPVDCDNDHSENPADWVTPTDVQSAFPGITFAVHYSRFHMREKNGKPARPKFHVLFPIEYMTDASAYSEMKKLVNTIFPYFDTKALDAARFFFGTAEPQVEIFPGEMTLSEYLSAEDFDSDMPGGSHGGTQVIPEGNRNATMSRFAGRVIKKYGDNDTAFQCFMEEAEKCTPPLEQQELTTIWHSAQKFYAKVQRQDGYVPPEVCPQYGRFLYRNGRCGVQAHFRKGQALLRRIEAEA